MRRSRARLALILAAIAAALALALFRKSPEAEAALEGYEAQDANAGSLFAALSIFAAGIAISIGLMLLLLGHFHAADATQNAAFTRIQRTASQPPAPRLQPNPLADLARLQQREAATQTQIDRTMARLVGRPLDPPAEPQP
jgi:hypothetical protein